MIVPVIIDTTSILETYTSLTKNQVDDICDNIAKTLAANYATKLSQEANATLHQTKKRYINAIQVVDSGRLEGTVILHYTDPLVRMIEEGASPFDLKDSMLNSQKAKVNKRGGRYITVPFRIATPGAVAESDVFSGTMPEEVYKVAKAMNAPKGGSSSPLEVKDLPVQFQSPAKRAEIKDSEGKILFNEYVHKTSIYAGMVKKNDAVTGQNSYHNFRRVSEELIDTDGKHHGSDPDSWIHKGIERYNLVSRALSDFNMHDVTEKALNGELSSLGLM